MSGSSAFRATTDRTYHLNTKGRAETSGPFCVGLVASQHVFEPQFFFFQLVEDDVVGVGPVLLVIDSCLERGVLGCDCLDLSLVHRSISFRWLTRDRAATKP